MLPRVLLHVIEAPRPVEAPFDPGAGLERPLDPMPDLVPFNARLEDGSPPEGPSIERLAAAARVERGRVQYHTCASLLGHDALDDSFELFAAGIFVVEATSQEGRSLGSAGMRMVG